jgi:hypothetical protein
VGDRGHRKGQLRVLGSPSARHTKEPRTGGAPGGRGVRGPYFFFAKVPSYISEDILKPECRPPGPIGTILATDTTDRLETADRLLYVRVALRAT